MGPLTLGEACAEIN